MNGEQSMSRAQQRSEAAHWFNMRLAGEMTADDERSFRDWIERTDFNREAFYAVERAWHIAGCAAPDMGAAAELPAPPATTARLWRRHRWSIAASVLLLLGIGWTAMPFQHDSSGNVQAFQTATGQRTEVTLPDGSAVTLDSETEMRFAETASERRVDLLRGRAFFRVASNHARPFIVHASGKSVRAVGTAFEVSLDGNEIAVVLTEGKVRVEEAANGTGNSAVMAPGRQLVIGANRKWTLSTVDVEKETSWTEGRLIFMHDPLAKAVTEVNRYSAKKLTFQDGAIPDKQIVGVFAAGDVDGFVRALELYGFAKRVPTRNDEILLAAVP